MKAKSLFISSLVAGLLSLGSAVSHADCITDVEARKLLPKVAPNLCGDMKSDFFRIRCHCTEIPDVEDSPWGDGLFYTYCIKDMTAIVPEADSMTYHKGYLVKCDGTIKESKYAD